MKARLLVAAAVVAGLIALGISCSAATSVGSTARLVGSHDLALFDELGADGSTLARVDVDADGNATFVGLPNRYLVVTSADTNELRVLTMYRENTLSRYFERAPNPLETLSIPVIDRPSKLAVDEGRHADGRRVTGAYIYAARPGGAELSIVGANTREQTSSFRAVRGPLATPAPVTAIAAWMGTGLTSLPATTSLFVATFDGSRGSVFRVKLPTNPVNLRVSAPAFERVIDVGDETVVALQMLPPLATRTVEGQPFCATTECLAVATRKSAGMDGRTFLVELDTLRTATLAFPAPVRALAAGATATRLFGILDEEKCGSSACAGVIGVDTRVAPTAAGFPVLNDFSLQPMLPLRAGESLPMGVALAEGAVIRQTAELTDGGTVDLGFASQPYDLLGVFSSSNGELSFFDGLAGTIIDYDARRTTISAASLQIPGTLPDGGASFVAPDGGPMGTVRTGVVTETVPFVSESQTAPYRQVSVTTTDAGTDLPFTLEIADGFFYGQSLVVIYGGLVPGLVGLPTIASDGIHLTFTAGLESRVEAGDHVIFFVDAVACGDARVVSVGSGTFDVDQVPAECALRNRYSVRAGGTRPLVIAADLEGFIARSRVGDTLTWNRRYAAFPPGFDGVRTSLKMTLGTIPELEGAFWDFTIDGKTMPYRIAFDNSSSGIGCSTQVPGRLVMAQFPTLVSNALAYPWGVMTAAPSANGVVEANLSQTFRGVLGLSDGARCYR